MLKGKEGGKAFDGMTIVQIALRFGVMPSVVKREPEYWVNRILFYMQAETEAGKLK